MNRYITTLVFIITFAYSSVSIALAQVPCSSGSAAICNPLQATSVTAVLIDVVNAAIPIGAIIAVLAFIIVGFRFIMVQGNSEKLKENWKYFGYICIGTAILLGAKVIITVIEGTLSSAGAVQPGLLPSL